MDNKIFTITTGSRISAFLEEKNDWEETHHNVNRGSLHYVTFCYFSNGKI